MVKGEKKAELRRKLDDRIAREFTINIHKRIHGRKFTQRANYAIKAIQEFVTQQMGTTINKIDSGLNHAVWKHGIRKAPFRLRIRCERKRMETEGDADEEKKLITIVSHVPVESCKGLTSKTVPLDEEDEE